jgi:hypothetical protein
VQRAVYQRVRRSQLIVQGEELRLALLGIGGAVAIVCVRMASASRATAFASSTGTGAIECHPYLTTRGRDGC